MVQIICGAKEFVTYDEGKSYLPGLKLADIHGQLTDWLWLKQKNPSLDALGAQSFPCP